jgi:hypothetical protein
MAMNIADGIDVHGRSQMSGALQVQHPEPIGEATSGGKTK